MVFACKKCKKAFRKDMTSYEESDEFCPHCDNHYVRLQRRFRQIYGVLAGPLTVRLCRSCRCQVIEAKTPEAAPDIQRAAMVDSRMDNRFGPFYHSGSSSSCSRALVFHD